MPDFKFTLRALHPSDSPALIQLITEFDDDMTTRFLVDPYAAIISGTEYRTLGVVVETPGYDGLVGMGTVRFSKVQFNGETLPLAFLDGLKVHKEFRGKGLGYQIARWRIERAREAFGDECVIATGMLHDNHASRAVAMKWCREFFEPDIDALFMPIRSQRPNPSQGIMVREIEPRDYQEFSPKQNAFYKNHNLYSPGEANSISINNGVDPSNTPLLTA